jgi:hypothetical protein
VFDETRSTIAANLVDQVTQLGNAEPPTRVRLAIRGWVAFGEEVVLDWLSDPESDLDRPVVADLLEQSLLTLVATAAAAGGTT